MGFNSLELCVGMQVEFSLKLGCEHAEVGFNSLELGVGMQRWGSTGLNWVWACGGGV